MKIKTWTKTRKTRKIEE